MSQTKITLGIFVLFLLALPLASAQINDTVLYFPFETTVGEIASQPVIDDLFEGEEGHVTANDSTKYNYGWNGSIQRTGSGNAGLITLESSPQITLTAFSWNGWFKDDVVDSDWSYWSAYDADSGTDYPIDMNCYGASPCNTIQYRIYSSDGNQDDTYSYTPSSTTWGMWTMTYDGSNVRLYRNGAEVDSFAATGTIDIEELMLSIRRQGGGTWAGSGKPTMDDVSFWNETLNTTQITELYNGGAGKRVDEISFPFNATWYSSMDTLMSQNAIYDNTWAAGTETLDAGNPFAFVPVGVPGIIDQANLTATSYNGMLDSSKANQVDLTPSFTELGISSDDVLSFSFWFKGSDIDTQSYLFGSESGGVGFRLAYYTEGVHVFANDGSGCGGTSNWIYGVDANEWHLATVVYNGVNFNVSIDAGNVGSEVKTCGWSYNSANDMIAIAGDFHESLDIAGEYGYTGDIQDFTIYDYALTQSNIVDVWQSGAPTQLATDVLGSSGILYQNSLSYKTGNALEWGRAYNGPRLIAPAETALEIDDSSITIAAWGKKIAPSGGASDVALIFLNGRDEGYFGAYKMYISGGDDFTLGCNIADFDAVYASTPDDGTEIGYGVWAHYVCVFDYDTKTLYRYVNGVSSGANTSAASVSWDRLPAGYTNQIGGRLTGISGDYDNWEGFLDEVRVYNRSLNSTEVLELYNYNQFSSEVPPPSCEVTYKEFGDEPQNSSAYYPFEYTSSYIRYVNPIVGDDGHVVGLDSDIYNYGRNGSAYFDGADKWIETYVDDTLQDSTFSFWAKATDTSHDARNGIFEHGSATSAGFAINYDTWRPLLYTGGSCYVYWDKPGDASDDGEWHYWTVYVDGSDVADSQLYVDNVLIDINHVEGSGNCQSAYTGDLSIGQGAGQDYTGHLDEFYAVPYNMTIAERTELYNSGAGKRADESSYYNLSDILYYNDFDGLKDQSDNGNMLTTVGDPFQDSEGVPGIIGATSTEGIGWNLTATSFNGIDDYIMTSSTGIGIDGAFSVSLWAKINSITDSRVLSVNVQQQGASGGSDKLGIGIGLGNPATGQFTVVYDGEGWGTGGCDGSDLEWHHLLLTREGAGSGTDVQLYMDGNPVACSAKTGVDPLDAGAYTVIGAGVTDVPPINVQYNFNGEIQDFNLWDKTLSAGNATILYQSGAPTQLAIEVLSSENSDLIYNNSLTYNKGTVMDFDGVNDYIETTTINEDWKTLSIWLKTQAVTTLATTEGVWRDGTTGTYDQAFFLGSFSSNCGATNELVTLTDTSNTAFWHWDDNQLGVSEISADWHHYTFVYNDTSTYYSLYLDGVNYGDGDRGACFPGLLGNSNIDIGVASSSYFEGKMDEFRVYNRSLNHSEITALYNYGQLSFVDAGASCITSFGTTVDPATVYTVDSMTCTALWQSNFDPSAPTSVNFTQTWYNDSTQYSQFNRTGAADGQIYNLIVPSAATLYDQNWTCEVNWTYNPTLSQSVARTIQNSLPVISGNLTWTDLWFNPLNRTFTCTDPDTTQNLTMFINDAQANFYSAGTAADLSGWSTDIRDITYDVGYWYVLDDINDQVIKFNSSWQWEANYSLAAANTDPHGFFRDGFARWYVADNTADKIYEYNNNFTAVGTCAAGCAHGQTNPQDLYRLGDYWFILKDAGGNTDVYRYILTEGVGFGSQTLMDNTASEDTDMTSMWYWGDNFFYLIGNQNDKIYKYHYNETTPTWNYIGEETTLGYGADCLFRDNYYWYACKNSADDVMQFYSNFTTYVNMSQTGPNTTPISALFNHTFVSSDVGNHYINISCNDSIGHTDNETFYQYIYATNYTNHTAMSPANGTVWFEVPSLLCSGGSDPSNSSTYGFEYYSDTDHYLGYANADVSLSWINASYNFHDWSCRPCLAEGVGCGAFGPQFSITPAVFDVCPGITASTIFPLLNFTFKDEMTDLPLNATAVVDIDYTSEYEAGTTKTYSFQYINTSHNPFYDFCVAPAAIPMQVITNSFIYSSTEGATNYPARDFGFTYNLTSLYNQTLYLLDENTGTYSTFITVDEIEDVIPFVTATVERQNLVAGEEWTLVASGDTDASGAITFWLNPDFFHRFIFEKTGYEAFNNLIKPTQSQYLIGLGLQSETGVPNSLQGIGWMVQPTQWWLVPGQSYTFTLNLTASLNNLYNCKMEIYNESISGTLLATTGEGCNYLLTGGAGDNLTTSSFTMPDNSIYGVISVKINSTSADWTIIDSDWVRVPINFTGSGGNSLQDFFSALGGLTYSNEGDQEDTLSKVWFFFLILAILISIFTFATGEEWQSPLSTLPLILAIIWMSSAMGGFLPSDYTCAFSGASSFRCLLDKYYAAWYVGLITGGYLLTYFSKRQGGEL